MQTNQEQPMNLKDTQNQRAFWISIGTGAAMLITFFVIFFTGLDRPLTGIADMRVFLAVLTLCGFTSAWLARQGRTALGIGMILGAFYIFVFWTSLYIENLGVAIAAVSITLTFGVTSAVMPSTRMARYANALAFIVSAVVLLMDVFQPFKRNPNDSPEVTWVIAVSLVVVYGVLVFRQFNNYSLRTKLTISFLVAAIVPLAIMAFVTDRNTRATLTDEANRALLSAASQTAIRLDTFVKDNLDTVRTQANLPELRAYLSLPEGQRSYRQDEISAILSTFARENPIYISSVGIYDLDGITLIDTYTDDIGTDKSDRSWFQRPLETRLPYVSNLEFSQTTSDASIYFSAPVRDSGGEIIGVLRKRYNAAVLQEIVSSNNNLLGTGSFAVLLDAETHVRLAHGTTPSIIFKSVVPLGDEKVRELQARRLLPPGTSEELSTNLPEFEAALDNYIVQPFFLTELRVGDDTLEEGAIVNMEALNWHVIYAQEQESFIAPINAQARNNILLAFLIAAMVTGFALMISNTLSRPIVRLTQTAEAIAAGDINLQVKVESGDEIGTLAGAFNRMTLQLREFITSLEERVAARTKDLATVAKISTQTSTIRDPEQMLASAVHLTQRGFNLYHAHVFSYHKDKHELQIVACGYKEGDEHEGTHGLTIIPVAQEQSLVARAARTRKPVIVNDVRSDPGWLPNPLLPDTRAELAVPLIVGDELLGVLDVQADHVDAFTEADASIQMTLSSQIATSYQSALAYEQAKAQADLEALVNAIGQKIQRTTTVEETLQTAVREVGVALGATRVSVKIGPSPQSEDRTFQHN
jgi:HAMP domain-containing protein